MSAVLKPYEVSVTFFVYAESDTAANVMVEDFIGSEATVSDEGDEPGVYDQLLSGHAMEIER